MGSLLPYLASACLKGNKTVGAGGGESGEKNKRKQDCVLKKLRITLLGKTVGTFKVTWDFSL